MDHKDAIRKIAIEPQIHIEVLVASNSFEKLSRLWKILKV
jgi:hypothetical protein